MRTLQFDRTGTLASLKLLDLPEPVPAAGESLVRVHAAGLNPSDVKNVLGRFPYTTLPRTPGRDFAGTVAAGPDDWIGRAVWGTGREFGFTRDGSHADYIAVPTSALVEKPECLSFAEAAACGVPYVTAWDALQRSGVGQDTRIVVIGAGGAVGAAAIALAKALGAKVVAAVRRSQQADQLARAGYRTVLMESEDTFERSVRELFPDGADVIFDTTGFWLPGAIKALASCGRVAIIAAPADGHDRVPVLDLYRKAGMIIGVNSLLHDATAASRMIAQIGDAFQSGRIAPPPPPMATPFDEAIASYEAVNEGFAGKIVFTMGAKET